MDRSSVTEFIGKEVPDWDDEVIAMARFKAFSGQRSDWELKFRFWRDLILKIARHFGIFIIRPQEVKEEWFNRGGLTPLCIDHVLSLMYNEGDIVRSGDLVNPRSGRLSNLFVRVRNLTFRSSTRDIMLEDHVVLTTLLKEKAGEVVKLLSDSHWTSSCIVTLEKFEGMCDGPIEASAVLSYLSGCGKGQYLSISKKEFIEGVKVSLTHAVVSGITSLDCDVLHLIWTTEKLQRQLDIIDRRHEMSRKSALACLSSGNKKLALRHVRELKLATESREKCSSLLNRVEEVLSIIADAESTKKVSEAIQIGARAVKENRITVEDIQLCLEELEEGIGTLKEVEKAIEFSVSVTDIENEDIEEEFRKLELEIKYDKLPVLGIDVRREAPEKASSESAELLTNALSNLKLGDGSAENPGPLDSVAPGRIEKLRNPIPEAA
ncbi:charged multivesicular body protein 7 isoform X2 [Tripterygium wilfordii]|uniref:charged multivesicular body protein 7 isoform X2 n=1 Tax=Tripterygium wilfordii TaxID=458696 RepID=UPI0018F84A0E|nr:charged multivesicular body protein 7 isoform X2 [Tripterygium wilfordii]